MSGWEQTHRRYNLVYAVADDLARRGPVAIDDYKSAIDAEYGGIEGFLLDVQRRWFNAVDAHLDVVLEARPADVDGAVAKIVGEVAETDGQLRTVLEAFADHPVLAGGEARHRRRVLALTGVDSDALVVVPTRCRSRFWGMFKGASTASTA